LNFCFDSNVYQALKPVK